MSPNNEYTRQKKLPFFTRNFYKYTIFIFRLQGSLFKIFRMPSEDLRIAAKFDPVLTWLIESRYSFFTVYNHFPIIFLQLQEKMHSVQMQLQELKLELDTAQQELYQEEEHHLVERIENLKQEFRDYLIELRRRRAIQDGEQHMSDDVRHFTFDLLSQDFIFCEHCRKIPNSEI